MLFYLQYKNTHIYVCGGREGERDGSVSIASRYRLDGPGNRIPVRANFSAPVQAGLTIHPAYSTTSTVSVFPGVKLVGHSFDQPPSCNAQDKERVALVVYSPSGPPCLF